MRVTNMYGGEYAHHHSHWSFSTPMQLQWFQHATFCLFHTQIPPMYLILFFFMSPASPALPVTVHKEGTHVHATMQPYFHTYVHTYVELRSIPLCYNHVLAFNDTTLHYTKLHSSHCSMLHEVPYMHCICVQYMYICACVCFDRPHFSYQCVCIWMYIVVYLIVFTVPV